ncbi:hypothetical protein K2173_001325 [Erythroxylum novogranatense]|uniref:sterol 22-desaturase n=1 Tax=Erythroxylum novogranatense TaxID=1862640 RepID=A0AAV8T4G9_9ROSI|nr:hypothetical protein K2173_001325 [Erythroxylum novogranatense]
MFTFLSFCAFSVTPIAISLILLVLFLEQASYLKKKRQAAGAVIVVPFLGNAISLIRNPAKFWKTHSLISAQTGFSVDYILGKFFVFLRSSDLSHVIFSNLRPDAFLLVVHVFGTKIFGEDNLMSLFGQDHKDVRRRMAPSFSPRALFTYTDIQQKIILRHLNKWERICSQKPDQPICLRFLVRDLNLETSQTVFVGPYLTKEYREEFNSDYNLLNNGLMKLPIDLPGFAFRNARLALGRLEKELAECTRKSKAKMENSHEPSCLVDFFMQEIIRETSEARSTGKPAPAHSTDAHIASFLFTFLFAAQDASSSSLLWAVALLDSHPTVLSRVREEVARIWSPESDTLISADQIREMKYTQAVAREVIRYRPPATLVPHIAMTDFQLTESYTIPKGAIVFPSVLDSCLEGFSEPDMFDPDRFSEERQEDQLFKKQFLAFGAGPHQCVGQRYALNYLVIFIAMFCTLFDFKRHRTDGDGCDELIYVPTICPKDGCTVFLSRSCSRFPNLSTE